MLQAYSTGLSITANSAIPFNNITITKGCAEKLTAPATIELNKRGVYLVECDGFGTGTDASTCVIQLYINGTPMPQAISSFTSAASDVTNFNFKTLVQVSENNCNCNCYSSPTVLQVYADENTTLSNGHINIIVTKIC